jgi:hypothetical protein
MDPSQAVGAGQWRDNQEGVQGPWVNEERLTAEEGFKAFTQVGFHRGTNYIDVWAMNLVRPLCRLQLTILRCGQ